jgi:hypothetical protein
MSNMNVFLTQNHEKQGIGYGSYGSYFCECIDSLDVERQQVHS